MQNVEEYKVLRDEIKTHVQLISNYHLAVYTITGIILGLAINTHISLFFLVPFVILVPASFNHLYHMKCTIRLGSYIQVFFESEETGFLWETRRYKLLFSESNKFDRSRKLIKLIYASSNLFLAIVCVSLFLINCNDRIFLIIGVIISFISICLLLVSEYMFQNSSEFRKEYIKAWENIKNNE